MKATITLILALLAAVLISSCAKQKSAEPQRRLVYKRIYTQFPVKESVPVFMDGVSYFDSAYTISETGEAKKLDLKVGTTIFRYKDTVYYYSK